MFQSLSKLSLLLRLLQMVSRGWDTVLTNIKELHPDVAERRIAAFWASWKRKQQLTRKVNAQKRKDKQSSASTGGSPKTLTAVQSAASNTTPPSSTATPGGGGEKRKHTGTPLSSEPAGKVKCLYVGKCLYTDTAGPKGNGSGQKSDDHIQILWVHSSTVDKGDLPEGHFHQVISRCNKIKIDGINNGEAEHMWCPSMRGQPIYDEAKKRGKIICLNKQTATIGSSGFQLLPI